MKDKLEVKGNSTWSIRTTCSRIEGSGDHCLIPSDAAEDMRCEARIEANEGCKVWKRCELGCVSQQSVVQTHTSNATVTTVVRSSWSRRFSVGCYQEAPVESQQQQCQTLKLVIIISILKKKTPNISVILKGFSEIILSNKQGNQLDDDDFLN
jgi:hypothetical protein